MTTSEGIPAVMNVTPTGNGNGYGNGWGGDWASWIILFLIFGLFGGGYGFGGFGGFGGMGGAGVGYGVESIMQRQLDTQSIIAKLDSIGNGLCDGFYAMSNAINGIGTTVMQGFNQQTIAMLQGQNAIQSQIAGCCCDVQRAIDGVNYNAAANACATQTAIANATRDITDTSNSNTRAILDYLYQDKLSTLQAENQSLKLAASQAQQNVALGAMMEAQTAEILRRTGAECPTPAYIVQPPQPVAFQLNPSGQATFGGNACAGYGNAYNC